MALRNSIILFAALVLGLVVIPIPSVPLFIRANVLELVGAGRPGVVPLGFTALGLTLAIQAGPALRLGLGGWIRSLPLTAASHRRAMAVALVVVAAPLLVVLLGSAALAVVAYRSAVDPIRIVGLGCSLVLAGAAGVPVLRTAIARPIAVAGAIACVFGGLWIGAGLALGLLWDRLAGPIAIPRHRAGEWNQSPGWLGPVIVWRGLGSRVLGTLVVPFLLGTAALLYRTNNGLTVAEAAGVTRVTTLAALVAVLAGMADLVVTRRPPWPWARSLPVGSHRRVRDDVVAIGMPAVPILVMALGLDWRAFVIGAAMLPALALAAAGAIRRAPGRISRASGEFLVTGSLLALGAVVWPAFSVVGLAVCPALWWHAARADRRLVVTQWQSLHHDASGDSLAGDAR